MSVTRSTAYAVANHSPEDGLSGRSEMEALHLGALRCLAEDDPRGVDLVAAVQVDDEEHLCAHRTRVDDLRLIRELLTSGEHCSARASESA